MKKHRQINKTLVPQRKKGTKTRFLRKVTGEGRRGREWIKPEEEEAQHKMNNSE